MLQVYIGYDPREAVAYHTLAHSILRRSSIPVSIAPLMQSQLQGIYTRPRGPTESTEFSLTRFLVPLLSGYRGWSLFMDCDMLCRADFAELAALTGRAADRAVLVCKHDYTPSPERKFLNQVQTVYPRKNWSSLMLFNCDHPSVKTLTPEVVNTQTGAYLHRMQWAKDEDIGSLPVTWNWLEGWNEKPAQGTPNVVHFTRGGPWFAEWQNVDYADLWNAERGRLADRPQ